MRTFKGYADPAQKHPFLRLKRLQAELSQARLANLIGSDVYRVSAWELGKNTPCLENQIELARALKVPLQELQKGCGWKQTPDLMIRGLEQ